MKKVFIAWAVLFGAAFSTQAKEVAKETVKDSTNFVHLQEVHVVATRATDKTPLSYSDLNKDEIKQFNYGQDLPYLLLLTPSVVATSDAGTGIGYTSFRIRGTDANRINITSNGIPMNDAESQSVFWVNTPDFASSIEDIQVQRGVGTSTNGAGAFGASVNFKTEHISYNPYAEFDGSYGSFNTSKAALKIGSGQIRDHFAFDARISGINSDGYVDRASVDLKSYFAQASYNNLNTLLKFITFGGREKTYHAWNGVPTGDSSDDRTIDWMATDRRYNPSGYMGTDAQGNPLYYDDQTDNYDQTNYQLHLLQILNPSWKLSASLHYTRGEGYYEEYKTGRKLVEYGLKPFVYNGETVSKSDLVRQKHLSNDFGGMVFALNYKQDRLDFTVGGGANYYDGDHFGKITWVKNYAGDPDFYPGQQYYYNDAQKTDANIYAKANYSLNSQWSLFADLQYRFIDYKIQGQNDDYEKATKSMQNMDYDNQFNFVNPKAGVFYRVNPNNDLFFSFATGHREPNRDNYTDKETDEMPKAETLYDFELGYQFRSPVFSAGINAYYMLYKDQLILTGKVNDLGQLLTANVPDSYRTGIELTAGLPITHWLQWNGNVTFSRNIIKNYTYNIENWETGWDTEYYKKTKIAYSPDIIANSLFSAQYKDFSAGLQSSYVGRQYIDNSECKDRSIDPYFVSNLRLGYTFKLKGVKSIALNLYINNLFNEEYENNAFIYYVWRESAGEPTKNDLRYFPQAGTNVMANVVMRF